MAQLSSTNILGNLTVSNNATVNNTLTVNSDVYGASLYLEEDASSPYYLRLYSNSGATANRTLTLNTNNADRTISLSGNLTVSADATVSGTNTGDQTNISGNAATATKLATARTIGISGKVTGTATSFDGSENITISTTAASILSSEVSDATSAKTANMIVKRDSNSNFSAGTVTVDKLVVNTSFSLNIGPTSTSWGGDTRYPTLFSSYADQWVMHINPHISYTQNGVNGFTGSMTGATLRMASDPSASSYWDIGVGTSGVGTDKFSIGRIGSSFIAVDNAGKVGIGATSPRNGFELAIRDSDYVTSLRVGGETSGNKNVPLQSETSRHQILFSSWRDVVTDTVGAKIVAINKNVYQENNALVQNTDLAFFTLGTTPSGSDNTQERMRITNTGKVGIGTISPEQKLHISGGDNTSVGISIGSSDDWGEPIIKFNPTSTNYLSLGFTTGTSASNNVEQALNIQRTGNVGIGTTSPAQKLHVYNSLGYSLIKVESGDNQGGIQIVSGGENNPFINFGKNGTEANLGSIYGSASSGSLIFRTGDDVDRLTLQNSTGNVGIGTASPGQKLEVVGSILNTDKIGFRYSSGDNNLYNYISGAGTSPLVLTGGTWTSTTTQEGIRFQTGSDSSVKMSILNNGNVGIGTTSPGAKLDVAGDARLTGDLIYGNAGTWTRTRADAGAWGDGVRSGFYETNAPAPAANWPSGASSWWHLLDIRHSNTVNNYAMQFAGSFYDQNVYFRKTNGNAAQGWSKIVAVDPSGNVYFPGSGIWNSGGNVGIGTTSPQSKLMIQGASGSGMVRLVPSSANGEASIGFFQDTTGTTESTRWVAGVSGWSNTNKFVIGYNDGPALTIDTAKNVGIGTTSPIYALTVTDGSTPEASAVSISGPIISVQGAGKSYFMGRDVTNDVEFIMGTSVGGSGAFAGSITSHDFSLRTNNQDRVTIRATTGYVGIGTTSPTEKLEVNGYIKSKTGYVDRNLIDSNIWTISSGSIGQFYHAGVTYENERVWDVDPFGKPAIVWKSVNDSASDADGGWTYPDIPVSPNKAYRVSVWVKKVGTSSGVVHLGCSHDSTLNLDGSANINPYFLAFGSENLVSGRWYLLVGYIHANNDPSTTSYSAVYDGVTGQKIISGIDYKNKADATTQTHRVYNFYDTVAGSIQYFWGPRFEEITGNEPTIESLLGVYQGATNSTTSYFGGNVGIGTTSPAYRLHVESGSVEGCAKFSTTADAHVLINTSTSGECYYATQNATMDTNAWMFGHDDDELFKIAYGTLGEITDSNKKLQIDQSGNVSITGTCTATKVYGAVWNDIADFIEVPNDFKFNYGKVYIRNSDYLIEESSRYLQKGIIGIASDTYGFAVGQKKDKNQIPIAIGGWVLAYVDSTYEPGTPLTCSINGTLTEIKRIDKLDYPERIIAIFDRPEVAEIWEGIQVNGRSWVKII